jgi:hypothetical protein
MSTDILPDPCKAQDRKHKVFSRPWRIPPRTVQSSQTRVDSPRRIAQRQHRIRIERAVNIIARSGCSTRAAIRHVGLGYSAATEVTSLCDERGILRRHRWGTPYPNMTEVNSIYVKPRAG